MSKVMSVRLSDDVAKRLRAEADESGEPASRLVQGLVDEGLRTRRHPGIVFRGGPSQRRAAIPRGPDVWEVIGLVRSLDVRGDAAVEEAATWLCLPEPAVRAALAYFGEFAVEIDAEIEANERAAHRVRKDLEAQRGVLD